MSKEQALLEIEINIQWLKFINHCANRDNQKDGWTSDWQKCMSEIQAKIDSLMPIAFPK